MHPVQRRVASLGLLVGALGCAGGRAGTHAEHGLSASPAIELALVVAPTDTGLSFTLSAEGALPRRWVLQKRWAGEEEVLGHLTGPTIEGCGKTVTPPREDLGTHVGWSLAERCRSVKLRWQVKSPKPGALSWGWEFDPVATDGLRTAIAESTLVLPDVPDDTRVRIEVGFTGIAPGQEGLWSLGPGPHTTTTRAARHAYFAIGRFASATDTAQQLTLEARFAEGHFDVPAARRDLGKLLAAEAKIFAPDRAETLRVLVVPMPHDEDADDHGTSLTGSAILWMDGGLKWGEGQARLAAHEMFHLYLGQIIDRGGDEPDERTYWFSEGFTEHYTDVVMARAKVYDAQGWLEMLRLRVRRYQQHPQCETPNDKAEMRWGGAAIQLPYLRGSMVAAYVDAAMRRASGGKRSLDDLMRTLLGRARRREPPLDSERMLGVIAAEAGKDVAATVRAVALGGQRLTLPKDAFGPCVVVTGEGDKQDVVAAPGVDLAKCFATL